MLLTIFFTHILYSGECLIFFSEAMFTRKRIDKDFEVIAWQLEDRASRGGGEFGMWIEHEGKTHGLLVYIAGDEGTNVPYAPVVRVAKYEAAKEVSVSNGRRSAQGQKWAQKEGFFRTAGHTPIGCDRLYCGADNQPKFVIHNLANGLQEQRAWGTGSVRKAGEGARATAPSAFR